YSPAPSHSAKTKRGLSLPQALRPKRQGKSSEPSRAAKPCTAWRCQRLSCTFGAKSSGRSTILPALIRRRSASAVLEVGVTIVSGSSDVGGNAGVSLRQDRSGGRDRSGGGLLKMRRSQ